MTAHDDDAACPTCACRAAGEVDTRRRTLLLQVAAATTVAAVAGPTAAFAQGFGPKRGFGAQGGAPAELPPKEMEPQTGDRFTYFSKGQRKGGAIKPADLKLGSKPVVVVPVDTASGVVRDGSRFNQILLQRLDPAELDPETAARSAEGVIAYSAICTHTGCPVTGWDAKRGWYMCPCHQSTYDPRKAASVMGGPAPRALPALPLTLADGEIAVAERFLTEVGFGRV